MKTSQLPDWQDSTELIKMYPEKLVSCVCTLDHNQNLGNRTATGRVEARTTIWNGRTIDRAQSYLPPTSWYRRSSSIDCQIFIERKILPKWREFRIPTYNSFIDREKCGTSMTKSAFLRSSQDWSKNRWMMYQTAKRFASILPTTLVTHTPTCPQETHRVVNVTRIVVSDGRNLTHYLETFTALYTTISHQPSFVFDFLQLFSDFMNARIGDDYTLSHIHHPHWSRNLLLADHSHPSII